MSWNCVNCSWLNADKWGNCAKCGMPKHMSAADIEKIEKIKVNINNFLLSTTANFDVEIFFGVVTFNLVIGTGLFSDIAASFNDLMGSYSEGYQKKIDEITKKSFDNIKSKCLFTYPDSNAIIGLRSDYSAMAGNMIMVNTYGTAVKIRK